MRNFKRVICAFMKWCPILAKYLIGFVSLHLFNKKLLDKDIWLICEKRGEARDNGYHLYKYIRSNHPEINAYYVISSKSKDYEKVSPYGNIIEQDSKEHLLYYLAAKYSINSQSCGAYPFSDMIPEIFKLTSIFRNPKQKCIFLQHGIIQDTMTDKRLFHKTGIIDLFVSSTKKEREFIIEQYGYPEDKVPEVGLCRFDNLNTNNSSKEKIILIMPTWRIWLKVITNDDEFLNSEYCQKFISLLQNKSIYNILAKYDYKIVFYPHYRMQRFLDYFADCENERVIIASKEKYDVQDLLIRSSIMITDFSSVYFDFAYMGKPVVYYQFDEEKFFSAHYRRGYFSCREHGFGEVVLNESALISEIETILKNGCTMTPKFKQRREEFFDLIDNKNCERNFNAILSLEGRNG